MAIIDIRREHSLDIGAAKRVADELAADLANEFSIEYEWEDEVLYFERPGAYGHISVDENHIEVQAELNFLLSALKNRIETEIHHVLDSHFNV